MKTILDITGADVLKQYIRLYEEKADWEPSDLDHFSKAFDRWIQKVIKDPEQHLSLDTRRYIGRKTLALIDVLEMERPMHLMQLVRKVRGDVPKELIDFIRLEKEMSF